MMHNQRGIVLGIVIISSIVFAVAAYAVLAVASSKMQLAQFDRQRIRMRYAAESGLAIAYQRLFADPNYPPTCVPSNPATVTIPVDTDGNGTDDTDVAVTISNCGDANGDGIANDDHVVTAKVTF